MQVRLATLNVWALPEPLGRDVSTRIDALGRRIPALDLDLIAFQEVWTRAASSRLRDAGRRAGLNQVWPGGASSGGLLLLSRFPIEEASFERFTLRGEAERAVTNLEYVSGKGFATTRMRTPQGPLVVINTHLHASYARAAEHRHVPHRTVQAIQMAASFADNPEPVVALGDFNFREGEPDYQVLTEILGMVDIAAALDRRQNTTLSTNPYRNPTGIGGRKDYVFARSGLEQSLVPRSVTRAFDDPLEIGGQVASYSNHAGLVADLTFQSSPGATRPAPSTDVFDLAAHVLAQGENLAAKRQLGSRKLSSLGIGLAAAAALSATPRRMSRRRLLRGSLATGALLALPPSVGFSIVSEVLVPDEIRAFRKAAAQLAQLREPLRVAHS